MKTMFLLTALLIAVAAAAQPNSVVPTNIRATNTLDHMFDANGLATTDNLYGIALTPGTVIGNAYLNPEWRRTTLLVYDVDKMIEGYDARYEIQLDLFEIRIRGGVKVLNGRKVKSFVWVDSLTKEPHYFVNAMDYKNEENVAQSGFFEVLTEGSFTLLAKTHVVVKQPTYNEKLDMGQRDTRIVKRMAFYFLDNNVIRELPSSKKKLLTVFGELAGEAEEFIRVNRLSLDEPGHLRALFENHNGRITTD